MIKISEKELKVLEESAKTILLITGRIKKRMNADTSRAKAKANGNKTGRKKIRDDKLIAQLRSKGLPMRKIAELTGVSTMAVQRSLKEAK